MRTFVCLWFSLFFPLKPGLIHDSQHCLLAKPAYNDPAVIKQKTYTSKAGIGLGKQSFKIEVITKPQGQDTVP